MHPGAASRRNRFEQKYDCSNRSPVSTAFHVIGPRLSLLFGTNRLIEAAAESIIIRRDRRLGFVLTCAGLFVALATTGLSGEHYQQLKSFGFLEQSDRNPYAPLIEGGDGYLYSTTHTGGVGGGGSVFRISPDGTEYRVLHYFGSEPGDGLNPYSTVLEGSDEALYGTTWSGGTNGVGTIFRVNKGGSGYAVLHSFGSGAADGQTPFNGLIEGTNGALYGVTYGGGSHGVGTIFKVAKDGNGYTMLHAFVANATDIRLPGGELLQASDGRLYGVGSDGGGLGAAGGVFGLNDDGSNYGLVHVFVNGTNGRNPVGALIQASDGALYGATYGGGSNNLGTVFTIHTDGNGYLMLHSFRGSAAKEGAFPQAGVIEGTNGALYGTTEQGGSNNYGCVFTLNKDGGGFHTLHHFSMSDGQYPEATVLFRSDGLLYGTTWLGGDPSKGTVFKMSNDGNFFSIAHQFLPETGGDGTGLPTLGEATDGALYGTCFRGGSTDSGVVFKLNKEGSGYRILHDFGLTYTTVSGPRGGTVEGADGALFGVASQGAGNGTNFGGAIFKIGKDGNGYQVLRYFGDGAADGTSPLAGLISASNGVIYGTTYSGGSNGGGTVFRVSTNGTGYGLLHSFSGAGGEGKNPLTPLFEGSDSALYGSTWNLAGGVFRLNLDGGGYSVLHDFGIVPGDGSRSKTGMAEGIDGLFYGATFYGGSNNVGTVFRCNRDGGGYLLLHEFSSGGGDGQNPSGRLVKGQDAWLYGTTEAGGSGGQGTVFRISGDGSGYSILHHFQGGTEDGAVPMMLILGSDGAFYGTTSGGGGGNFGSIFRLLPPETPEMLGASTLGGSAQVRFSGLGGYQYQLFRSADIVNWTVVATVTMPPSGIYTFSEPPLPGGRAFYRAAWTP